jgi:hypothetical protein
MESALQRSAVAAAFSEVRRPYVRPADEKIVGWQLWLGERYWMLPHRNPGSPIYPWSPQIDTTNTPSRHPRLAYTAPSIWGLGYLKGALPLTLLAYNYWAVFVPRTRLQNDFPKGGRLKSCPGHHDKTRVIKRSRPSCHAWLIDKATASTLLLNARPHGDLYLVQRHRE